MKTFDKEVMLAQVCHLARKVLCDEFNDDHKARLTAKNSFLALGSTRFHPGQYFVPDPTPGVKWNSPLLNPTIFVVDDYPRISQGLLKLLQDDDQDHILIHTLVRIECFLDYVVQDWDLIAHFRSNSEWSLRQELDDVLQLNTDLHEFADYVSLIYTGTQCIPEVRPPFSIGKPYLETEVWQLACLGSSFKLYAKILELLEYASQRLSILADDDGYVPCVLRVINHPAVGYVKEFVSVLTSTLKEVFG